jgi:ABC-type Fe3+/spermidine/putrescine transport system ATPase subunit
MDGLSTVLNITSLHVSYGNSVALTGVDLAVGRGEFVALLGPSGCGKTSLLRAIAGLVHPQSGSIFLSGRDILDVSSRDRNIGFVFQSYALFPHMTVLENVRFGLECRGIAKTTADYQVQQILALVGLESFGNRRPRQLSGGQQQRVALARALVIEPDLLLLDEPLAALDKQLRVQMQTELKQLHRRLGITTVFVTHDQEEAMSMADRIVVLRNGQIEQDDTPEQLFANPSSSWVSEFIGAGSLVRGDLRPTDSGRLRMEIGPGSFFEVASMPQAHPDVAIFIPSDQLRLRRKNDGEGLIISGRRYLGQNVELQIAYSGGSLRAQMKAEDARQFQVGGCVQVNADPASCRLLPVR